MAIKVKRQDDLDAMFGKFAEMDPTDKKRDKFLKHDNANKKSTAKNEKRPKRWFSRGSKK